MYHRFIRLPYPKLKPTVTGIGLTVTLHRPLFHIPAINASRNHFRFTKYNFSQFTFSTTSRTLNQVIHGKTLKPFLLADIGEGITGCEIVKWLVNPGEQVAEFDPIAEVQSDKATVEITSPYEGTIESLVGQTGQVVKVGEPLCMILVNNNNNNNNDQQQISLETVQENSKSIEKKVEEEEKQQLEMDSLIELMDNQKKKSNQLKEEEEEEPLTLLAQNRKHQEKVHSTPSVRRLAQEHQVDMTKIQGTGKDGRITKEDVLRELKKLDNTRPHDAHRPTERSEIGKQSHEVISGRSKMIKKVPFGAVRQAMFRGMTKTLKIPHFGYYDEIDVTELERIRRVIVIKYPNSRVTLLSLFVKIMGKVMMEHDLFRSTLSQDDDSPLLLQRPTCDISIAVNTPSGLLTPLIPNVESLSVIQIAHHISALRAFISNHSSNFDKIPRFPDELGGNKSATMTLSNIGSIGGTYVHPVIPPTGQLAIGGIGSIKVRPEYATTKDVELAKTIAINGSQLHSDSDRELRLEPRLIVQVSFTADHRAVQGVELAQLVNDFKALVQTPALLFAQLV